MTQDELKMVLESLEDFADVIKYENEQDDIGRKACCDVLSYEPHYENCKAKQAITALEEALAEHAMQEVQRLGQEIEQEQDGECKYCTDGCPACDARKLPAQRTWVGLTEQEHTDIAVECGCMSADWVFYGAAVERKLKERNT